MVVDHGQGEAHLIALACGEPPEGRAGRLSKKRTQVDILKCFISSFRRKPESSAPNKHNYPEISHFPTLWIPAFAGMTGNVNRDRGRICNRRRGLKNPRWGWAMLPCATSPDNQPFAAQLVNQFVGQRFPDFQSAFQDDGIQARIAEGQITGLLKYVAFVNVVCIIPT